MNAAKAKANTMHAEKTGSGMLAGKKAVIFDMDGTLMDSMWVWQKVDEVYMGKYGLVPPDTFHKDIEGMSYTETAQYFVDTFPVLRKMHKTADEVKAEWSAMTLEIYRTQIQPKPGAKELIRFLNARGVLMGMATSSDRILVEAVLSAHRLRPYFRSIRTSCEVSAGKPAPDVYLKVAEDLGAAPSACLVFEDVPNGIRAGKNAGMEVCAVDDAFTAKAAEEKRRLADYFIRDFREVYA